MSNQIDVPSKIFLQPKEVAEVLGVGIATLANWRAKRIGPKFVKIHSRVRYRSKDLLAWMDAEKGSAA